MSGTAETAAEILAWLYAEATRHIHGDRDQPQPETQRWPTGDQEFGCCTVPR